MNRRSFSMVFGTLLASACRKPTPSATAAATRPQSMRADLTFITRDECVNSPDLFNNLDDALRGLGRRSVDPLSAGDGAKLRGYHSTASRKRAR